MALTQIQLLTTAYRNANSVGPELYQHHLQNQVAKILKQEGFIKTMKS